MRPSHLILPIALLLCACTNKENPLAKLPDMSAVRANLAFTCVHETAHLPPLNPDADVLFRYARHLQKADGPKDYDQMARYYRIAAAHGHYKANRNLQNLVAYGQAKSPHRSKEVIDLASKLIEQGVPGGYYDIGHYLEIGYGLKQDKEMALRYFRKAADLGSPDAQFYVAKLLAPWDRSPEIARQMRECAVDQGLGKAAGILGISLKGDALYTEAVKVFQKGVVAGDTTSTSFLGNGFGGPPRTEELYYLALPNDPERSRRYKSIGDFLDRNDGRNPKVPDIDQIVPLPPAKLPPWDSTFQWEKEQAAAVPPEKPSDELIQRLAKEKNLDPATGLLISPPPKLPLGTKASAGERCPQEGLWCVPEVASVKLDATRHFKKGDKMPPLVFEDPRLISGLDRLLGKRETVVNFDWKLISYDCDV